jgi:hypothetical protein
MVQHLADRPTNKSTDDWFAELKRTANLNPVVREVRVSVDGLPALKVRYRNPSAGEMEAVYVICGSRTFEISFGDSSGGDKPVAVLEQLGNYETYARMVNTFRVTR